MDELIYNQHRIPKQQWRYGLRSSAATGCGWIAIYNALRLMGYQVQPEELIRSLERQVPVLHGNIGTTILAPALFLKKQGFQVSTCSRPEQFDALLRQNDVGILFYYWHAHHRFGAHFVAVRYHEGQYLGYNTFRNSDGPDVYGLCLKTFLQAHHYHAPVLTVVRRPEK